MAERLGQALLDLDTNDKAFVRGIDSSERRADTFGRKLDETSAKAIKLGRNLAIGAAAGAAAMGFMVKRAIDQADAMSKAALRAGVSTEALSRMAWAGELSDVTINTLTSSMGRLANVMGQVARGEAKQTKEIFDQLGIAVTDNEGRLRSTDAVMIDLAETFANMENGAEKTALAIQIFGRSGADLIPLLNNGRAGLAAMADEADRLGKTISTETGRRAEQFNDTMTRIGAVMDGVMLKVADGALPALNELMDRLADPRFAENAEQMANWLIGSLNAVIDAVNATIEAFAALGNFIASLSGAAPHQVARDLAGGSLQTAFPADYQRALDELANQLDPEVSSNLGPGVRLEFDEDWQNRLSPSEAALGAFGDFPFEDFIRTLEQTPAAANAAEFSIASLGDALTAGAGAAAGQTNAVNRLIEELEGELELLRETDPVQREMLRLRETLAHASDEQREKVEDLIAALEREKQAQQSVQEAMDSLGQKGLDAIDGLMRGTGSLADSFDDLAASIAYAVLQAALLGQGPLAGLFGMGGDGGLFGMLGGLFSGFFAKGGLIPAGTFGIVGEKGPEPVIGTGRGAMVLPNSSLSAVAGGGRSEFKFEQNITPPDGYETRTSEEETPGGKRQDVWFEEAVAGAISKPGRANSAVRSTGRLVRR